MSPPSSQSPSERALVSLNSTAREADASVAFFTFTHASFPSAALKIVKDKLFASATVEKEVVDGMKDKKELMVVRRPISSRKFSQRGTFANAFESGRVAFVAKTLQPDKPAPPTDGIQSIDFGSSAQYSNSNYEEVEFDCLLKLPLPASCEWTREPAQLCCPIFVNTYDKQALPLRGSPIVPLLPSHPPPLPTSSKSSQRSRFSQEFYPNDSTMYVVGETYAALGEGTKHLTQKLLQAERSLQFLCAKEGKLGAVEDCILGMVFMGTATDAAQSEKIYQSLRHYQKLLPCLWTLQGLGRLLCYHVRAHEPAVESMRIQDSLASFKEKFDIEVQQRKEGQEQLQEGQEQVQVGQEQLKVRQEQLQEGQEQLQVGQEQLKVRQEKLQVGQEQLQVGQEQLRVGQELILQAILREREERERARACCTLQ